MKSGSAAMQTAAEPAEASLLPVLSVVIVSWNTRALLRDCLETVFRDLQANSGLRAEVWVVDNASADDSPAMVREAFPQACLLENADNIGFARANNQALREARGRYLLLLNSDTLVPEGALTALVAAMESEAGAAVCSPLLLNGDGSPQYCWARFPGFKDELAGSLDLSQSPYPLTDFADAARRKDMRPFPVDWVGGACFLVRASAMAQVGLLDEGFFMYCEETEWCHRFRAHGWQALLVPGVTVTHLGGQSSKAVPAATRQRMYRSRVRLYGLMYDPARAGILRGAASARLILFRLKNALRRRPSGDRPLPL